MIERVSTALATIARGIGEGDASPVRYALWRARFTALGPRDRRRIRAHVARFPVRPRIALVMTTRGANEHRFGRALASVFAQLYPEWELVIAVGPWTTERIRTLLAERARDPRVVVVDAPEREVASAMDRAVDRGNDFVGLFGADAKLSEHALYLYAAAIVENPKAELLYGDEDSIDDAGVRSAPKLKPDFSPDFLRSTNYVGQLALFQSTRLRALGGLGDGFAGSEGYDLVLRFSERRPPEAIVHLPFVVHHAPPRPPHDAAASEGERRTLAAHVTRLGLDAEVVPGIGPYQRVRHRLPATPPRVSIVIGTRDRAQLMRAVCRGVLEETDYPDLELIVIDNGSTDHETLEFLAALPARDARARVIRHDAPFNFSEINDLGVAAATGSIVCLLNNDIEVIHRDWLTEMVSHALRPEVGVVGARLLYANDTLQHAGVVTGIGGVAGHVEKGLARAELGYLGRPSAVCNYSAVTAACIVMRKAVFDEVGGLDALNLTVAFNDVDLCLEVRAKGYLVVYTPHAELYHLESVSRGSDTTPAAKPRFAREIDFMQRKWGATLAEDPYSNPNLSDRHERFALARPPRVRGPWRG